MAHHTAKPHSTRLTLESLESRDVPSPFGATQGLSVAAGAVFPNLPTGVGPNQYVMGSGPGVVATVRVFDDQGNLLQSFRPFGMNFRGGVTVAVGDVNDDGVDDIICGTGPGGMGRVRVFTFADGGLTTLATFTPFGPNFRGGVNVAAGPVLGGSAEPDGERPHQIVVSVASNGPPRVKVFGIEDGVPTPYRNFLAYAANYRGGVNIAVANIDTAPDTLNGGGELIPPVRSYAEIITGKASQRPLVRIFDVQSPTVTLRASFMAFDPIDPAARRGVTLTAGDTVGQRGAQIFVNLIGTDVVRVFDGATSAILTTFNAFPAGTGVRTQLLSMTIADMSNGNPRTDHDQFTEQYFSQDLIIVAADGLPFQVPYLYFGGTLPAGFNGGGFAI